MPSLGDLKLAGIYVVVWCGLDYVGFLFEVAPGISPWYPPHGWSVAFLATFGLRFWPWLLVGPFVMGSLVWLKGEWIALAMLSACVCGGYSLSVYALRRLKFDRSFATLRDAAMFIAVGAVSSFFVALASILSFAVNGLVAWSEFLASFFAFWAGDTLGVICLAPFFLVNLAPYLRHALVERGPRYSGLGGVRSRRLLAAQCALAVVCLATLVEAWDVFASPPLYLLFVPAIWIAITQNIGASTAATAAIPVFAVMVLKYSETSVPVADVQLFVAVFSGMALCLAALVAERRAIGDALRRSIIVLERSNADLDRFAHAASHDLQQPLRTIAGFADLLRERWKDRADDLDREYFEFIRSGVADAQALVASVLDFAGIKRDAGSRTETSFEDAVEKAVGNLSALLETNAGQVTHGPLPVLRVSEAQIVRLFQNLIQNALVFRSELSPRIHVSAALRGDFWTFTVADNGRGFDPYIENDAFEPFKRYHATNAQSGTGFGLSICRQIVMAYGGNIGIDRNYEGGACVFFELPKGEATAVSER